MTAPGGASATSTPISLTEFRLALESLSIGAIESERRRLENSILHLEASNRHLEDARAEDPAGNADVAEYIEENLVVISSQRERIQVIAQHLVSIRGGDDAHYSQSNGGVYL